MEKGPCCMTSLSEGDKAKNNPYGSESSSASSTSHFLTHLWGLHTISKLRMFLRRMYNNILPTRKNLSRKITSILPCCAIYPGNMEDILHIFFQCRVAIKIWLNSDFSHFVNLFLSQHLQERSAPIGPIRSNVQLPIALTQDGCHSRPQDSNRFKLNVDAAWIAVGAGVVDLIRYHSGRVRLSIIVALDFSHSSEHAETVVIREGFRMAERFGYTHYILESDCKVVIDQLLTRLETLGPLGHIHEQILSLIHRQSVILLSERRHNNVPAHLLAAQAVFIYPSNV
ncbi:hypothetical protein M9H77_06816 [Catharanthus roseus]|uniref:Uncharacterized protein n=1 Tax=Catharanthus roseus TaxID=4058 RepID=A0ACC0BTE3_CATRO|nr:hypothetical protein M9H77_06816 [Catharanthus roseus]